ncbi:MAG TPA: ATP-dependent sacrificial sulfur transferase LarE, partial [Candidatus Binatia bacterium]
MDAKFERLNGLLREQDGLLVAFSAGVDSTFLLKVAHMVLGEQAIALTASSPTAPPGEVEAAKEFAKSLGCRHIVLDSHEMSNPLFAQNPVNRCFFCKDELYRICRTEADKLGIHTIVDGTNLDDLKDHRPGLQAANQWGVRHPLVEAEMTKADIRRY